MGATFNQELAEDIKNLAFRRVAELIRKGDISALDQESRELLADYLEGKWKRGKGAPRKNSSLEAENLYDECEHLMNYGMLHSEFLTYWNENATAENFGQILTPRKVMTRTKAIGVLADKLGMGVENVKRLVYLGKQISEEDFRQRCAEEEE